MARPHPSALAAGGGPGRRGPKISNLLVFAVPIVGAAAMVIMGQALRWQNALVFAVLLATGALAYANKLPGGR